VRKQFLPLAALAVFALVSCAQNNRDDPPLRPGPVKTSAALTSAGRALFLRNCAHCHGADAHDDEGPDLHNLHWTDEQITNRIRNGKNGQMTAFAGKLSGDQISQIKDYVRSLR